MKKVMEFIKENKLFIVFIICSVITSTMLRFFTIKNYWNIKPLLADLGTSILIGSFSFLFSNKKRFIYLFIMTILGSLICFINCIYYNNYMSFASISLIGSITFLGDVSDAVIDNVFELKDLMLLWQIPVMLIMYFKLYKPALNNKKEFKQVIISAILLLAIIAPFFQGKDYARLWKQWNREYIVMQFGVYIYQIDDLVVSLKPQLSNLFGADNATKAFREYYDKPKQTLTNDYTGIFKDKNVIVIHAESLQNFALNTKINGNSITPNLDKLIKESLYFSNFFAQDSVGTSSDTEFTFATSLLPTNNGTVFINYWNRKYETIQQKFNDQGYYTFAMHANNGAFWNRNIMYNTLGYNHFYYYDKDYDINEKIGLGLSDKSFFKQSIEILKEINANNEKVYGTLITLTNHTPFTNEGKDISNIDLTYTYSKYDPKTMTTKKVKNSYLEGTQIGSYFKSVHYADEALGQFIDSLKKEGLLENTVLVIYGDHDAKLKKSQFNYYYNYDPKTNGILDDDDENYNEIDNIDYELLRKVPLIIWSSDIEAKEITEPMAMIDVMPTLANMFGFKTKYALGNDIFSTKDNTVVFPNGDWLTSKLYYDTQRDEWKSLEKNQIVSNDYIKEHIIYADNIVTLSNSITIYDLINKTEEADKILGEK